MVNKFDVRVAVFVSGHGLGHINQMRPLLKELCDNNKIKVLLITNVSKEYLELIGLNSGHIYDFTSLGVLSEQPEMKNSIEIDIEPTKKKLQKIAGDFSFYKELIKNFLIEKQVNRVISNIESLPLVAAQELKIPNFAMCSLDWWQVYSSIGINSWESLEINGLLEKMKNAYQSVDVFFRPQPYVDEGGLENTKVIEPQFVEGANVREQIDCIFNTHGKKLILINFGGVEYKVKDLPVMENIVWVLRSNYFESRKDVIALTELENYFTYEDAFVSMDFVITKPGYGTYVLAASCNIPVLSLARENWPDVDSLEEWVQKYSCYFKVKENELQYALSHIESFLAKVTCKESFNGFEGNIAKTVAWQIVNCEEGYAVHKR